MLTDAVEEKDFVKTSSVVQKKIDQFMNHLLEKNPGEKEFHQQLPHPTGVRIAPRHRPALYFV